MVCFGRGSEGQKVSPLEGGWTYVSAGWKHTCALQTDSTLYCWGDNRFGQATIPTTGTGPQRWRTVASGSVPALIPCSPALRLATLAGEAEAMCWRRNENANVACGSLCFDRVTMND